MSDLTDYAEEQFMQWAFHGSDMDNAPSTLYIALHDADPGETPDGTNEIDASDYDRESVTADDTEWDQGTDGDATTMENANEISFGTATSDWGTVSHFSIWDGDADSDNAIWYGNLDSSKTVEENDEIRFQAGDLTAQID